MIQQTEIIEGYILEVIREEDCPYYHIKKRKGYDFLNVQEKEFKFALTPLGVIIRDIKELIRLRNATNRQLKIINKGIYVKKGSFRIGDKVYISNKGVKKV